MTERRRRPAALVERRGNVLVITINRPEARNAVNGAVSIAVGDALAAGPGGSRRPGGGDHRRRRQVVLRRSRSQGASRAGRTSFHPDHAEWGFAGYVRHFIDKPTIAAVNGTALGGGTELALASDLVVAEESAKFGLPEVKRGLIAAAGGVFRIVEQLPRKVAMELMFTGEPMSSADALKWGLINQVVPDGTALRGRAGAGRADHRQCAAGRAGQQAGGLRRRRRRHHRRRSRGGSGPCARSAR